MKWAEKGGKEETMHTWRELNPRQIGRKKCAQCGATCGKEAMICSHCTNAFCSAKCGVAHYRERGFDFVVEVRQPTKRRAGR